MDDEEADEVDVGAIAGYCKSFGVFKYIIYDSSGL